ncbi:DUF1800 domain-containing protein [Achromobacter denitrificans]|uniref:DUF1800 domain-containing protein n=2 Tax=Achromobacter denitrificans TaxID=32002 RepID=UPI0016676929|nr:DUF1800 domain-containing protein [Achromobacter denitrificans]MBV2162012.1 DUF1800 domain-containing protein [Achromobacter denitrificans]WFC69385.1 DUF1800 domain-containing protein [Achromobacter denitrificans]GFN29445.1 hypothetical protein ADE_51430 [Achromobacter denitrificans]
MSATPSAAAPQSAAPASARPTPGQASRFLAQATFGPTPADIDAVVRDGYAAWLDAQLAMPPSQTHFDWLLQQGKNTEAFKGNGINAPLESTLWRKFITAPDQVRTRVAFSLSEIFVVGVSSITASWPLFGAAGFMDLLAEHALGSYPELLGAVSRNLSMGCMLTYRGNRKEDPKTGRHPDENYAREIMQLFSIGLLELEPDGTVRMVDGAPVETYSNADVQGLAKVFTGWDINGPETDVEFHRRPMALNNALHSMAEKRFLGAVIPAGTDGHLSLKRAVEVISAHPNVGPFIGTQLIQRLVTSNPSHAYVGRVAAAFDDDGTGRRGNLKAVVRAILLDPEAREPDLSAPEWGKVREPILRFSGWARAFGANSTNGAWAMPDTTDNTIRLAQSPMRSASVFNFFRPRYVPPVTELARRHLVAPELQITDETSVAGYLNFLAIYVDRGWEDLQTPYTAEIALARDPAALVARVALLLAGDTFSAQTAAAIARAVSTIPADRPRDRVRAAITLVASTPEYLVQK